MAAKFKGKGSSITGYIVSVLIILVAVSIVYFMVREEQPRGASDDKLPGAMEKTQALVEERMHDKEYRALLAQCQQEQVKISQRSSKLREEISIWIESHEEAKALSLKMISAQRRSGGEKEFSSTRQELESLMKADDQGRRLLQEQEELERDYEIARARTADVIGAKIREQTAPKR